MTHDNVHYAIQMELWKGDVTGALQMARQYNQLDDWIVSLAPLGPSNGSFLRRDFRVLARSMAVCVSSNCLLLIVR